MPVVIDPQSLFIGAAKVWYRTTGGAGTWTDTGITVDDATFRVNTKWFRPDNLNGIMGSLVGIDILTRVEPEIEFSLPSFTAANIGLIVPGSISTARATTDAGGTPFTSTLAAAAAAGDTNVKVTAVTNLTVGQYVRIEASGNASVEYRQIDAVGTIGSAGTGIDFREPLLYSHANAAVIVQTVGDGRTEVAAPTVRRQPASAYRDWALMAPSGSKWGGVEVYNAISQTESVELTFGDETLAAVRATIQGRYSGSALTASPFKIIVPS